MFAVYPAAILEESFLIAKDAVVIGISQQGTSAAVIRVLDEVRRLGIATLSVTGEYNAEITRHSDANLYIECGYEGCGCDDKGLYSYSNDIAAAGPYSGTTQWKTFTGGSRRVQEPYRRRSEQHENSVGGQLAMV